MVLFCFVIGFFQGISGIVGHELVHYKEWYNKFMGTWPYTLNLYSHFGDEHVQGHHKYIATDEDPVSGGLNDSVYYAIARAIMGTQYKTYERSHLKLVRENDNQEPNFLVGLVKNKMVRYWVLHAAMLAGIY